MKRARSLFNLPLKSSIPSKGSGEHLPSQKAPRRAEEVKWPLYCQCSYLHSEPKMSLRPPMSTSLWSLPSQRQTYGWSPIKMMRLLDELRIQNQGRWLCTLNVPWPSASTAGCICLPNRDSLVDGAFIFTSYWLISNLFKDCQETLIYPSASQEPEAVGRGVWNWLYPPLALSP